ncbi:hypothetical protein AALO_G00032650 [Alosa alosa]|uniref:Uncharacterized protein n=1 Tax=Alosa alosa TaxID=278164 RepID=A0AAV6HHF0_9TELE|nr:hypothetical protein AALO_G00032650 [Alosa alosa]
MSVHQEEASELDESASDKIRRKPRIPNLVHRFFSSTLPQPEDPPVKTRRSQRLANPSLSHEDCDDPLLPLLSV